MLLILRIALLASIVLTINACSSSTGSTPDGYYMTATIGSDDFSAAESTCKGQMAGTTLVIAGSALTNPPKQFNISVPNAAEGQTFTTAGSLGLTMICTTEASASGIYTASMVSGNGTITITKLTTSEAVGTFSFTGANTSGATKAVTNGKFRVKF